jgi:hypothetical protein
MTESEDPMKFSVARLWHGALPVTAAPVVQIASDPRAIGPVVLRVIVAMLPHWNRSVVSPVAEQMLDAPAMIPVEEEI